MKIFFRYFLFLALCSCCYTASAGTDDHVGYVVGNNYGVGPSGQKWREKGPNGDVTVKFRYGSVTNNLVFYKPTQLGPTRQKEYALELQRRRLTLHDIELELQKEAKKKTPQIRFSPFEPATPFTLRFYSAAQNACWAVKLAHDGALSLSQCDERMSSGWLA